MPNNTENASNNKYGERLKNRILEEIFPSLALGFVNYARQHNRLPTNIEALPTEERNRLLEPFFNGTLTFLYRMLFLFYAESRDLLPMQQECKYYKQSLQKLKLEIAQDAGKQQDRVAQNLRNYSQTETALYDRLQLLFQALDQGNPSLNVPIYNGGLFLMNVPPYQEGEPAEITAARFLAEHKIPDRQLALGLDRMARDVDERMTKERLAASGTNQYSHELVFIDYKSLAVCHLGSIYEGLLELKLRIAPEELAIVEGKRTEEIIPHTEAIRTHRRILKTRQGQELKKRLIERGAIYLENNRHERKTSGSYYTPDYIVKYIVEQTVGPILKQKLEHLHVIFQQAQQDLHTAEQNWRSIPHKQQHTTPEQHIYERYRTTLNEAFFDIKVLDPAMGSGHFLIEAINYITDQMAKWLYAYRWNPIVYELELTRKAIEADMKQQHIPINLDQLTALNLLKCRVLKSCIYGVDLNPMAVELTRISLWLDCFTPGAPLPFLNHHIKCGNSLIGAEVSAMPKDIQKHFFHWELEFPEIYFDERERRADDGFDAIVGNPPYGPITDDLIKAYCRHRFKAAEYQVDNYVVFIEASIYLARDDGIVGFIVPSTYIGLHYFTKLRAFILEQSKPRQLLKLTFPVFEDATVESSILILQRSNTATNDNFSGEASIYNSLTSFLNRESISTTFHVSDITNQPSNDFFFLQASPNSNFVRRLHTISVDLAEICDMTVGIKPYQVGKGVPKQTDQVVQNRSFDAHYQHDTTYKRYIIGRDITRYHLAPETERWISYGEWLAEPRLSAPFFEQSKLLVRQTANSIIAARDTDQFITLNNLHNLKINVPHLEECYILALLNSKLATYYFRTQVGEVGRVFAEVKLVDLAKLPIRRINFTTPKDKRAYYRNKAQHLYQQYLQEHGKPDCIIHFVDHHLSQQPEASDIVHDLLALLAEEMQRLHKAKHTLQQEFLTYLITILRIKPDKKGHTGIEAFTGKSKLLNYAGDYQKVEQALSPDELWKLISKNRARIETHLTQPGLKERILAKYQQNLDKVLPLKEQLQHTDALIDRVVYRLYELTEEEIAIVEDS